MNKSKYNPADVKIIEQLELAGENLNALQYSFYQGITFGDLDDFKSVILKFGISFDNNYAIMQSSRLGHIDIVDFLLKQGLEKGIKESLESIERNQYFGEEANKPIVIQLLAKRLLMIDLKEKLAHLSNKNLKTFQAKV